MRILFTSIFTKLLVVCGLAALVGCATVDDDLQQPSNFDDVAVDFSNMPSGYVRTGRFVDAGAVAQVESGLSRFDVRSLLGSADDERSNDTWFYVINLPLEDGVNHLVCQYRVSFDGNGLVTAGEWRRPQCHDRFNTLQKPEPEAITLASDVLFAFDSAELTSAGINELNTAIGVIKNHLTLERVSIVGHTDRTGPAAYNQTLSVQRSEAVRRYFVSKGVPSALITAEGRGSREPLVECEGARVTESLKQCLQSNRRVEISIHGRR